MMLPLTSDANFWRYSSEFDYRKYFETQSHADTIIKAIDRDIAETATGLRDLRQDLGGQISAASQRISSELSAVGEKIQLGFIEIDRSLGKIESAISSMHFDVIEGLQNIEFRLEAISNNLTRIEDILRNPEKTWAFEMLREAERLYIMGDIAGSLSLLNRIIEGDSVRPGIRTEWQLHYLRAKCLMGGLPHYDPKVEDRESAIQAFKQALKCVQFVRTDKSVIESDLLWQIGWAYYTLNRKNESLAAFSESFERNNASAISLYEISKIYFEDRDITKGRMFLRRAAELQPVIFDRAAGDKVMVENKSTVIEEKNQLRAQYTAKIKEDAKVTEKIYEKFVTFERNLQDWKRLGYSDKQEYVLEFSNEFRAKLPSSPSTTESLSGISLVDMHEMKNVIDTKCEAIPEVQKHLDLLVQSIKRDLDVSRSDKSVAIIGNNEMQEARLLPALKAGIVFSWILPFYILAFMAGEAPFSGVQGWDLFWSIVQSVLLTAMAPLMFFGGAVMILSESPAASMIPKNYYPITIGIFIVSFAIAYILSNRDTFARNRAAAASQKERKKNAQNAQAVLASLLVSMSELSECLSLRAKSSLRLPGA